MKIAALSAILSRFLRGFLVMQLIIAIAAAECLADGDTVTPYPRVSGDEVNADFSVKVNDTPVEACRTVMNVGYAHFAFTGTARTWIPSSQEPRG
jgi:hypothetical protein